MRQAICWCNALVAAGLRLRVQQFLQAATARDFAVLYVD
jgi:hypothetical protein